jgi:hypothetical protein
MPTGLSDEFVTFVMLKGTDMTLTEKIQTSLIGADYPGALETENLLSEIIGVEMYCYDSVIDDGADDDETEDQYVMRDCFTDAAGSVTVRVYYGDVTGEIGYVDVDEPGV